MCSVVVVGLSLELRFSGQLGRSGRVVHSMTELYAPVPALLTAHTYITAVNIQYATSDIEDSNTIIYNDLQWMKF